MESAAGAAVAAARAAVDVCLSGGAFGGFTFFLKIDNPWLAASIAIGTFYIANKALTERAVRNALQQQTSTTANADPEVTAISTGSILVQLQCYSEESFLRFIDDIDSKTAKYREIGDLQVPWVRWIPKALGYSRKKHALPPPPFHPWKEEKFYAP